MTSGSPGRPVDIDHSRTIFAFGRDRPGHHSRPCPPADSTQPLEENRAYGWVTRRAGPRLQWRSRGRDRASATCSPAATMRSPAAKLGSAPTASARRCAARHVARSHRASARVRSSPVRSNSPLPCAAAWSATISALASEPVASTRDPASSKVSVPADSTDQTVAGSTVAPRMLVCRSTRAPARPPRAQPRRGWAGRGASVRGGRTRAWPAPRRPGLVAAAPRGGLCRRSSAARRVCTATDRRRGPSSARGGFRRGEAPGPPRS